MAGTAYYDLYDNGKLIGRYSGIEIQKMFGWKKRAQVGIYSDKGTLYKGRYRIARAEVDTWADEWDRVRQEILRAGR